MNNYEKDYLKLLDDVLTNGKKSSNRTGINTYKVWGRQTCIDLSEGFPLMTTKRMHWKSVVHELLWMIAGDTNIQYLLKNGVTFWTEWPYREYLKPSNDGNGTSHCSFGSTAFSMKEFEQTIIKNDEFAKQWGSIGKFGYGGLWRKFPHHFYEIEDDLFGSIQKDSFGYTDQLQNVINDLKTNPDSRRIIISAWHPFHSNRIEDALLPACHNYIQFGTEELTAEEASSLGLDNLNTPRHRLNCYYSMRSNDIFLGKSYNDAFYSLFTILLANSMNMIPGKVVASIADLHLYENHVEQAKLQLGRIPMDLPTVVLKVPLAHSIFDIKYEDIDLVGYNPQPSIKADVAI